MLVRVLRDITVSYKYEWLFKNNVYDTDKVPEEVAAKLKEAVKKGKAVPVKEDEAVKVAKVGVNQESIELEKRQQEQEENAEALTARATSLKRPKSVKKTEE